MQLLQLLNSFVNSSATAPFRRQDQQELGETLTIAIKDSEEKQRKRLFSYQKQLLTYQTLPCIQNPWYW